ncbi:carbohydrate binding domain-containing protein [Paenibacillus sonchi]|uniref:Carbohydrate binding domain-containing protein n=1 Tax=Paenibacillus sonchi TaxID=373687 RepID=A0A974SCM1_9BACL|nr:carbohydrate binding domain-containing protein [Paenibacillus sonchi]QQZ61588.1 carbohydrate binding domain-containing protein [Paenibacillus sonchi]
MANSNFEAYSGLNGIADGWNAFASPEAIGQYEVVSNPVSEGSRAQKISVSDMPKAKQGMNIWQDTNVRGGSKYEISGRVKLENMVNMQMSIVIHYFDSNNQLVGQYGMDYKQNTMDWVKLSGILNVPTNATTARIHFHMSSTGEHGKGTAYVDGTALVLGESVNELFNPGFEKSVKTNGVADGWNAFVSPEAVGQYEVVLNPVSEGSRAQKISVSDMPKAKQGMNIWQDTNVRGGSKYEISGRVKLENMVNMQMSIVIHYFDSNNQLVGQYGMEYKQNTMDWVKLSGILNVPTNATTARIHFHMNSTGEHGKGTAYVDGTALVLGERVNELFNPGFEKSVKTNGVADGWNIFVSPEVVGQYEVVSNPVSEGSRAQKINVSDMPKAKQGMNIWQDTNVRGGSKYEISGRVKLENMVNMQMSIVIHYFDSNNQLVGQYGMEYKQNTMDWVKLSGILNVPTNATTARIHFHMNSTGEHGKGTAYVDDTALVLVGI